MSPPSRVLSLQPQGDGDEGLCGLEKYHLTHLWARVAPSTQPPAGRLSLFNAFNTFQMVRLL